MGFFSINRKRTIGFSFDNLSLAIFRDNSGLKNGNELNKWVKDNGNSALFVETAWAAAQSYAAHNGGLAKFKLSKRNFMLGLSQITADESKKLTTAWKSSQSFGFKQSPGKKKAVKR